jgi:hypothetical protein
MEEIIMKKKIIVLLLGITLLLSACGNAATSDTPSQESTSVAASVPEESTPVETTVESLQETIQDAIDEITDDYAPQATTESLNGVCDFLESESLVSGDRTEMAGEMIGAISGIKYADSNVEIYEYDTESDKYKTLVDTGKVMLDGFDMELTASAIHNQYVLFCDDASNASDIIEAFNNMN